MWKQKDFYISKWYDWSDLLYGAEDIQVIQSSSSKLKMKSYEKETMRTYFEYWYNSMIKTTPVNYAWVKKTDNWDYYIYAFYKYNEYRSSESSKYELDKTKKNYQIRVIFLDKIDDEYFYKNDLRFIFDKPESKKIIDDFVKTIKTSSWKLPFELWDIEVWKNVVEKEGFKFK